MRKSTALKCAASPLTAVALLIASVSRSSARGQRTRRALCSAILVTLSVPGYSQQAPVEQTNWRYDEDWSVLRDKDSARLPGWTTVKYQPLTGDGSVWVSTGIEARARVEDYRGDQRWSAGTPDNGTLWLRVMPHADLHAGRVRVFVQGIAGYAPGERLRGPTDETGIDVLQAFAEASGRIGSVHFTARAGRQLVGLGSERLVTARYGTNIPQSFDGYRLFASHGRLSLTALRFDAVAVGRGNLDDRNLHQRSVGGFYATATLGKFGSVEGYWLSYRNGAARFNQGYGEERRQTAGLRLVGGSGRWTWNWEGIVQWGRFGPGDLNAWSVATETGYAMPSLPLRPRVVIRANLASGDRHTDDGRLETFNALFPRGKYFGELSPVGPQNLVNLQGRLDLSLSPTLAAGLSVESYWRHRTADGVYSLSGALLRHGEGKGPRHIGTQEEVVLTWTPSTIWSFTASASSFTRGSFLRETGQARTHMQFALEARLRI